MNTNYYIQEYVRVKGGAVFKGKTKLFQSDKDLKLHDFLKEAYIYLQIKYPKFHKMDALSKLGILATSVLFHNHELKEDTALVFSNSASSLETDKDHSRAMKELVSPAIFVYTLPNIVLGEISIKNNLKGENSFFIEPGFNPNLLFNYSETLLNLKKSSEVVCGWIDLENGEYDVFLFLISRKGEIIFSEENLEKLYLFDNE